MITVFTPTYNRARTLPRLYESLKAQTDKGFEWIVINDGSADDTDALFEAWLKEDTGFPIRYETVPNGGKHRAINKAVPEALGDAFFIVDSDDYLLPEAVEKAGTWFRSVADDDSFAGVSGLRSGPSGEPIGGWGSFDSPFVDATNLERHLYNLLDDKAEVYKTSVLSRYPFPEYEGENFVPESLIWDHIAKDGYKLRWYNEIIYVCEYQADGLTADSRNKFTRNPKGFLAYLAMLESIHDPREVDVFRLRFYNDLIKEYGQDKAFEYIRMAPEFAITDNDGVMRAGDGHENSEKIV